MNRPWLSAAPAATDKLVALVKAKVATNPAISVHDGPWVEGNVSPQALVIGWTGFLTGYQLPRIAYTEEQGQSAITGAAIMEGLGAGLHETFSIHCGSLVRVGNTKNTSQARVTAYANIAIVGSVIGPPWIGGTVMKATFGSATQLNFTQDRRGLLAVALFSIDCEAFAAQ